MRTYIWFSRPFNQFIYYVMISVYCKKNHYYHISFSLWLCLSPLSSFSLSCFYLFLTFHISSFNFSVFFLFSFFFNSPLFSHLHFRSHFFVYFLISSLTLIFYFSLSKLLTTHTHTYTDPPHTHTHCFYYLCMFEHESIILKWIFLNMPTNSSCKVYISIDYIILDSSRKKEKKPLWAMSNIA